MSSAVSSQTGSSDAPCAAASPAPHVSFVRRLVRELAIHDWYVLAFLVFLLCAALQGSGPDRAICIAQTSALLAGLVVTLLLVRGGMFSGSRSIAFLYRIAIFTCVQSSYFVLRRLLPTASPRSVDQALYQLDVRLFGFEPTLFTDQFITTATTEWFSFFYFSYFIILIVHVFPALFLVRSNRLFTEFAHVLVIAVCTAHVCYFLVPGFGPLKELASLYVHPFPRGFFLDLVMKAVESSGAQKDIFPSLHTAAPLSLALFSFRHRKKLPFRYTWPILAFFSANIIGATIFLRWHYLVDVLAGIVLAVTSVLLAARLTEREIPRRSLRKLTLTWPSFL